ncbi:CvpA family protein [uncultured Corynebacterium sp.]|uniref:CvpA family protein n=1 Tax=uncultured Corynebacterium sp. TaxID=159447 RepID=UPI00280583B7|nr:CvpA family protein [uncultured Corynebacterium sp.]
MTSSSTNTDPTTVIFLGNGAVAEAIRQALVDFGSLGLISRFIWADASVFEDSSSPVCFVESTGDGGAHESEQPFAEVLSRTGTSRRILCTVNVIGEGSVNGTPLNRILDALNDTGDSMRDVYSNVLIPSVGTTVEGSLPTNDGFIKIMLAPEDSSGPYTASVPVRSSDSDNRLALLAGAALAGLYGLWADVDATPIQEIDQSSDGQFRLARIFYRHTDGQAVQLKLKDSLFTTSPNPLPRINRVGFEQSAEYTDDVSRFSDQAADELLKDADRSFLQPRYQNSRVEPIQSVSTKQGLSIFLTRWAKNFCTTPTRFFRSMSAGANTMVGDQLQEKVYGRNSRINVGGKPPVPEAGAQKQRNTSTSQSENDWRIAQQLKPLWDAYANTAMSLVDAEPRNIKLGQPNKEYPSSVNDGTTDRIHVAHDIRDVIPGPSMDFDGHLPAELAGLQGPEPIAPYDVRGIRAFERRLISAGDQRYSDIGGIIDDFESWKRSGSASFATKFGEGLLRRRQKLSETEAQLQQKIGDFQETSDSKEQSNSVTIWRWLGWVTSLSLVIFVAAFFFCKLFYSDSETPQWVQNFSNLSASAKVLFFALWLLSWLVFLALQNVFETIIQIRFVNQRLSIVGKNQALEYNLRETQRLIKVFDVAYGQFISISRLLGGLMERPFGTVLSNTIETRIPTNEMPSCVRFSEVEPTADDLKASNRLLRSQLYGEGWLGDRILEGLHDIQSSLQEAEGRSFKEETLFASTGMGTSNALTRAAEWASSANFQGRDRSSQMWDHTVSAVENNIRWAKETRGSRSQQRNGWVLLEAYETSDLRELKGYGRFNGEFISSNGRNRRVNTVDEQSSQYYQARGASDAIGQSELLIQVGPPARQSDVALQVQKGSPSSVNVISDRFNKLLNEETDEEPLPRVDDVKGGAFQHNHDMPGEDLF